MLTHRIERREFGRLLDFSRGNPRYHRCVAPPPVMGNPSTEGVYDGLGRLQWLLWVPSVNCLVGQVEKQRPGFIVRLLEIA